ncbi:MAG: hemerythrin domain-containing protein [Streptosporangiales bacterium]|nr:hemerythrin domain-containing protein [Streptosporangiales bacterium]
MTDVIKLITDDHRAMEKLFDRVKKERDRRPELLREVAAMLTAHSRAEEERVYPIVAKEAEERGKVHHGVEEHQEAEELLHELEKLDPAGDEFDGRFREFVEAVKHHVEEEESEILPSLRDAVGKQRLEQLGQAFTDRREQELAGHKAGAKGRTRDELYQEAREMDISGRSGMKKDELAEAVEREKDL